MHAQSYRLDPSDQGFKLGIRFGRRVPVEKCFRSARKRDVSRDSRPDALSMNIPAQVRGFRFARAAVCACSVFIASAAAYGREVVELRGVGTLPGGSFSIMTDLSADGSTIVGSADTRDGLRHAFRWTKRGIQDLGTLGGLVAEAYSVSGDGSVVVGNTSKSGDAMDYGFVWTTRSGMRDFDVINGSPSFAARVSEDGSTVIGHTTFGAARLKSEVLTALGGVDAFAVSRDGNVVYGATSVFDGLDLFRWTPDAGLLDIGRPPAAYYSPRYTSRDGAVVVGFGDTVDFRWSDNTYTPLPTLGGTYTISTGLSRDGVAIVGWSFLPEDATFHAFRWKNGRMQDLGTLGGEHSIARDASDGGYIVVGESESPQGIRPFIWTEFTGMRDLQALLECLGAKLEGWDLQTPTKLVVTADKIVIAGIGGHNGMVESWVATIRLN